MYISFIYTHVYANVYIFTSSKICFITVSIYKYYIYHVFLHKKTCQEKSFVYITKLLNYFLNFIKHIRINLHEEYNFNSMRNTKSNQNKWREILTYRYFTSS